MPDPHAAFMRAQREYDNRIPPEAPESCPFHGWEYDPDTDEEGCPECISAAEDHASEEPERYDDDW